MLRASLFAAALVAVPAAASAQVILNDLDIRDGGVFAGGADPNVSGFAVTGGGGDPVVASFTYNNLDLDGDSSANDSVDLEFTWTGDGTGFADVRLFNQGADTGFGNLNGVTVTVSASGTTTDSGDNIVFDGFTAATAGMGAGTAETRNVDINGTTVNLATTGGGFQFVTGEVDFGGTVASVLFDNSGGTAGSIVARAYDIQLSTESAVIPEPASLGLLGVAGLGLMRRRR